MKVDFYHHQLSSADAKGIADVLDTPFLTTGTICQQVEKQLAEYFGAPHAMLANSWTNGALATLMAMGIGLGDEVIVPANTFVASANIVELLGAKTVLVDVDPATLLISPEAASKAVTKKTKAIMPVHLYGQMVDVSKLRKKIDEVSHGDQYVYILEDSAHCFEGSLNGAKPGQFSDACAFSFYATKNVTCGEGGAVIFRNASLYEKTLETRLHGMSATAVDRFKGGKYNHWDMMQLGTKANLPDLLAVLLPRQINEIDERRPMRQALCDKYYSAFENTQIRLVEKVQGCKDACHLFTIGVREDFRDEAINILNENGISVTVNFRALPDLTYYSDKYPETKSSCLNAIAWGRQTISLPLYPGLREDQQDHVIDTILNKIVPLL
jgi:UDP-4-amino-4-deoxy-L-arabinose-oxoglutarate aminotransferase